MKYLLLLSLVMSCNWKSNTHDKKVDEYIKENTVISVPDSPVYHIKIIPFVDESGFYCIHFTNDDWNSYSELMQCLKNSSGEYQTWLGNKENAIQVAKGLKTFKDCLLVNLKEKHLSDSMTSTKYQDGKEIQIR